MWGSIRELSFSQLKEYHAFCDDHHDEVTALWLLQRMMGNKPGKLHLPGICDACNKVTTFEALSKETNVDPRFNYEVNWWSDSTCEKCSLPCIDRSVLNRITKLGLEAKHIYHVGHYSRFAAFLRSNYKYITTSQYSADKESGAREGDLIFEDEKTFICKQNF
jgi:hypothetical protein